ncbi:ABC transporter ATP-binding protein [Streptomyces sp. Amel2xC10]|uniref:ABC transporter ATP-binding protein n=1 Tax=Streptomyces sp. Amel2xC10 TaxID=1305826 RepID=UPI000A08CD2E|nr:ATP-binding cassette domain-containing protein [Streptomyces sp. Amel2xC10]SMF36211.1 ATPase components of various ABC-type transport systems, contain duplicated ATPase [Streptomyces sp. Amel2xC10]
MLEVRNLRKEFGDFVAVDDVTFSLPEQGSLAIVGESGSGKTTTARMIAGLETPSSGRVAVAGDERGTGRPRSRERRARGRQIQMVFQDPYSSLDRRQRVGDAVAEAVTLHKDLSADRLRARVAELLDMVGLDDRQARSLPKALSGGQRQRVAIARALAAEPRLLILDEAIAALDVSIQAQILALLARIRADTGTALLFITHDLGAVRHISDDVLVMQAGRVVEQGPVTTVLGDPQDLYTRRLIASIPKPGWKPRRRASKVVT